MDLLTALVLVAVLVIVALAADAVATTIGAHTAEIPAEQERIGREIDRIHVSIVVSARRGVWR